EIPFPQVTLAQGDVAPQEFPHPPCSHQSRKPSHLVNGRGPSGSNAVQHSRFWMTRKTHTKAAPEVRHGTLLQSGVQQVSQPHAGLLQLNLNNAACLFLVGSVDRGRMSFRGPGKHPALNNSTGPCIQRWSSVSYGRPESENGKIRLNLSCGGTCES